MTPTEQEQLINEIEKEVDRLHALYNQYFMGIEKLEPQVPKKNLDRKIHLLRKEQIKNTALRFRFQMQIQKYNTQCTYWNRICREIENGTYKRQIMLAKRRVNARHHEDGFFGGDAGARDDMDIEAYEINLDELGLGLDEPFKTNVALPDLGGGIINNLDDPFADLTPAPPPKKPQPSTPQKPLPVVQKKHIVEKIPLKAAPRPTAPENSNREVDTDTLKSIYRRYLAARKKCNESIEGISFKTVASSLNEKYGASKGCVDFKVVIRGGKAVIKTVKKPE